MSNVATNGDYDASISSASRGDNRTRKTVAGSASSPLTDLETAEVLQSIRDWTNDNNNIKSNNIDTDTVINSDPSTATATVLPTDLALSLDFQTSEQQQQQQQQEQASYYWDASTMAPLNVVSAVSIIIPTLLKAISSYTFPVNFSQL